jgi:hypothetical protein
LTVDGDARRSRSAFGTTGDRDVRYVALLPEKAKTTEEWLAKCA